MTYRHLSWAKPVLSATYGEGFYSARQVARGLRREVVFICVADLCLMKSLENRKILNRYGGKGDFLLLCDDGCFPSRQLLQHPVRILLLVTKQAGVRAFFLSEPLCHFAVGDVVYLVVTGAEQQSIHDAWHVAGDTSAACGLRGMV